MDSVESPLLQGATKRHLTAALALGAIAYFGTEAMFWSLTPEGAEVFELQSPSLPTPSLPRVHSVWSC